MTAPDRPAPPVRPNPGGRPEPTVEPDQLTYACGRCGAIVGNVELHASHHVTIGHLQDDVEALTALVAGLDARLDALDGGVVL